MVLCWNSFGYVFLDFAILTHFLIIRYCYFFFLSLPWNFEMKILDLEQLQNFAVDFGFIAREIRQTMLHLLWIGVVLLFKNLSFFWIIPITYCFICFCAFYVINLSIAILITCFPVILFCLLPDGGLFVMACMLTFSILSASL